MGCGNLQQLFPGQSEDLWIYGNPTITFFKTVFKRHTNFAMNLKKINFSKFSLLSGGENTNYLPSGQNNVDFSAAFGD